MKKNNMFYKYITNMNIFLKKYFIIFTCWSFCTFIFEGKISLICDLFYRLFGIECIISIQMDNLILRLALATVLTVIQLWFKRYNDCEYSPRRIYNIIFENNKLFRNGVYCLLFMLLFYNFLFLLKTLNLVFIDNKIFYLNLYSITIVYFFILFCYFNSRLSYIFIGLKVCKEYDKNYKIYHLLFGDLIELGKGVGRSLRNLYGDITMPRNPSKTSVTMPRNSTGGEFVKPKIGSSVRPISKRILPICNRTGEVVENATEASNGIWTTSERVAVCGTILAGATLGLAIYKEIKDDDNSVLERNIQLSKDLYEYSNKTELEKFRFRTALRIAGIDVTPFVRQDEYFKKEAAKSALKAINKIVK